NADASAWMRCVNCRAPAVVHEGVVSPGVRPLRVPAGLPPVELAAWSEVRECLGVGASTAAVMLCRKLLLHVAVSHGLPEKGDKGRAPSFVDAVAHLEAVGIITTKMRPW